MEIRNLTGALIHKDNYTTLKETLEYCCANSIDLSYADLRYIYIDGNQYAARTINLQHGIFVGANFGHSTLLRANFSYANISGANFEGCALGSNAVTGQDCATFIGTTMLGTDFRGCPLALGAVFSGGYNMNYAAFPPND